MVVKKLLSDYVLVELLPAEEKTKSGIIIPLTAKEESLKGIVLMIGPGKKDEPMEIEIGDKVLFKEWSRIELNSTEGEKHLIIKQSDIYCVLEK